MKIAAINHINIYNTSFGKKETKLKKIYNQRRREEALENKGVPYPYSSIIAELPKIKYRKAIHLLEEGVDFDCVEEITKLDADKYQQALILIRAGIFDSYLTQIANLEEPLFQKALQYRKSGLDNDCLKLYSEMTEEQLNASKELMKKYHFPPYVAGNISILEEAQRQKAIQLLSLTEIDSACAIAKLDEKKQEKCNQYLLMGIQGDYVPEIAMLSEEEELRLPEIFSLNVGDINISDFAKMSENEYQRAKELLSLGVNPDAVYDIVLIEQGKGSNEDYSTYRERGYSYSTSASLSALNDKQIEALEGLITLHPNMRDLFQDEYNIEIISLQNNDVEEAILTKKFTIEDETQVTLVQTFDGYGESTKSRIEKYNDGTTVSMLTNQTGVFSVKKDKHGEIQKLIEYITDENTKEITGVIYTTASKLLKGAFESTYYDINDFKESSNTPDIKNIKDAVTTEGEKFATVVKNPDGSVTFSEDFTMNTTDVSRSYTEKTDQNDEIIYSDYSYKITDTETDSILMETTRTFRKNPDGSMTNIINGVEYKVTYNDKEKSLTITDGKKKKELDFKNILPVFSEEEIWTIIKKIHVDTLLDINENIKKWRYCSEIDSFFDEYNVQLSTGSQQNMIEHEIGHFKVKKDLSIIQNDDLIQTYGNEMERFKINMPYNGQQYIEYFSPRAELSNADGFDEFIAETNMLLNSYGIKYNKLNTRPQLLVKYFPKSIAKVAELLGKTSTKSLLE